MLDPNELIPTRDSLLSRLKDWKDEASWRDFFNTYWKLVYGVALRAGLTDQEAQEVVQETVITVARRIPEFKYDPSHCSFKTWLLNLTRWRITDQLRKRKPALQGTAGSGTKAGTVDHLPDPASCDLEAIWNQEWADYLVDAARERVKRRVSPEQYQLFDLCVFKEWPARKIARELGVSLGQVYLAKHRVSVVFRKELSLLQQRLV